MESMRRLQPTVHDVAASQHLFQSVDGLVGAGGDATARTIDGRDIDILS